MPLNAYDAGWAHPAKAVSVWNGTAWARAKKWKVWNGTAWILSWVHPVTDATLTISKSSIITGESFVITLATPSGFPEGAVVTFRDSNGDTAPVVPVEGATTATWTDSYTVAGSYSLYADVTTKGGNTTFGPVTLAVGIVSSTVAVAVVGEPWMLSTASGASGSDVIVARTVNTTLSNPAIVTRLSHQWSSNGGSSWSEYAAWNNPAAVSAFSITPTANTGLWHIRSVATQVDASVVYSAVLPVNIHAKNLSVTASPTNPVAGSPITYSASGTGSTLAASSSTWQYTRPADAGVWKPYGSGQNPLVWTPGGADDIQWRWQETFADGSVIRSNNVHSVVTVPVPTEIVVNGGHCHNIQSGIDTAVAQGKKLKLTGTFYLYTNVYIKSNLYITATGAMFYVNSNSATPGASFNAGRFKNDEKGGAGQYGQAGGFTIDGGTYDGNGEGCMTFSHNPGFVVKNARLYRYCSSSNTGHAIEINSSGGADNTNGPYTVQIIGNTFHGTDRGQRSNSNDEPVSIDWNWGSSDGSADSGASAPLWRPGNAISESSQVMCHNVLIQNNTFHRAAETGGWQFALCAIGGHDASDNAVRPSYRHNHFYIVGNVIHGAVGSTGTTPNKGAIHLFRGRQFVANSNTLYGGVQKRYLTAEDATDVTYCSAASNTSANPTLTSPNGITIEG